MKYNSLKAREKQKTRDQEILAYMKANPEATLLEIGREYNLTKQRISQIKRRVEIKVIGEQENGIVKINKK